MPEGEQPAFGFNCNTGYDNDDWVVAWGEHASAEDRKLFSDVREWIRNQLSEFVGEDVNELTAIYGSYIPMKESYCIKTCFCVIQVLESTTAVVCVRCTPTKCRRMHLALSTSWTSRVWMSHGR